MHPVRTLPLVLLVGLALNACRHGDQRPPPQVVDRVDLERYQGLWYEIASIPNRFQAHCAADTTAEYRLRADGRMDVINQCLTRDGDLDRALGMARVVDPASNARLEVSFVRLLGWQLFWGDYWILELAPDYSYAVVGTPGRDYGWILSRTPELSPAARAGLDQRLRRQGYNPDAFHDTLQRQLLSPNG